MDILSISRNSGNETETRTRQQNESTKRESKEKKGKKKGSQTVRHLKTPRETSSAKDPKYDNEDILERAREAIYKEISVPTDFLTALRDAED